MIVFFYAGLSNDEPIPKGKKAYHFIRDIFATFNPSLIIIDTLEAIRDTSGKENYSLSVQEFSELRRSAHQLNIVLLCVHHTGKSADYEVKPLDRILGCQGIAATVDTILLYKLKHVHRTSIYSLQARMWGNGIYFYGGITLHSVNQALLELNLWVRPKSKSSNISVIAPAAIKPRFVQQWISERAKSLYHKKADYA